MQQTQNYYQSVPPHPHQLDDGMDHFEFELSTHPVRVLSESEQHPPTNFEQSEGYFLKFCSLLSVFTTLCLFSTILLHAFCITATTSFSQSGSCFEFFYRLYGMLFAAIGFFCEMEWTEGIRTTSLLQYWTTRGLFYIFIALLTIQEYGDVRYHNILISKAAFVQGILLICFGMAYTCMGFLCSKKLRDERMARYIRILSRWEQANSNGTLRTQTPNNSEVNFR